MPISTSRVCWKRSSTASHEVKRLELNKIAIGYTVLYVSLKGLFTLVHPSVHPSFRPSVSQSVRPSVPPFVRLPVILSSKTRKIVNTATNTIMPSALSYFVILQSVRPHPPVCSSVCPSIHPSIILSVHPPVPPFHKEEGK